jgi:signal peptidase I
MRPAPRLRRRFAWLPELIAFAVIFVGRASFADHYHVPSGSMEPTLRVGDHLVVDKSAYGLRVPLTHTWLTHEAPRRGDVVVFDAPNDVVMVKRLVGLPGDEIAFEDGHLFINGERVEQAETDAGRVEALGDMVHPLFPEEDSGPPLALQRIPPDRFLLMGDHRGNSADGRFWGLLPRERLLGRAVAVLYSPREGLRTAERFWLPLRGQNLDPRLQR